MSAEIDHLGRSLQHNLVALLCFDENAAAVIRNAVELKLFESVYRDVAERIYDFWDQFKKPPKDHIQDLLEDLTGQEDKNKAQLYRDVLADLFETGEINSQYVIRELEKFNRQQSIKLGIMQAYEELQSERPEALDKAETILSGAIRQRLSLFDPGTFLGDVKKVIGAIDPEQDEVFLTGIKELDRRRIGPVRGGLLLFIAPPGRGKTWFLTNLGKHGLMQRLRVLHITTEMAEQRVTRRYLQALFAVAKRQQEYRQAVLKFDKLHRVKSLDVDYIKPEISFDMGTAQEKIYAELSSWGTRLNRLVIKHFPTGRLTVRQLEAYLESLASSTGFVPDMILLDYMDLMYLDPKNYRHSLDSVYKDFRGLCADRGIAGATASQSNRDSVDAKMVSEKHIAEDFRKIATADVGLIYSQTGAEKAIGLARLLVTKARDEEDKFSVLISQNYNIGQFCVTSAPLTRHYWDALDHAIESGVAAPDNLDEEEEDATEED